MARFLMPLADAAALGGKAGRLAQLRAAGLPVPDGVVLPHAAFAAVTGVEGPVALDEIGHRAGELARAIDTAEPPPALAEAVAAAAARLAPLAVRSSMSAEDGATRAAPGVFASCVDVPAADAWPAIRAVWRAAIGPLAIAYARTTPLSVAVIVQRWVRGARVTIYTRPPGHPAGDELWVEPAGGALRRVRRDAPDAEPLARLALAAERAIDAPDGADVEAVVADDGALWLVQARPIVHPTAAPARPRPPPALLRFSADTPGVRWRRDVEHNPDPLSPAQTGLVDAVVAAGASPWRLHVAAGHLYYAAGDAARAADDARADDDGDHDDDAAAVRSAAALRARFDTLAAAMRAPLDALPPAPSVGSAVDAYVAAYRVFAHALSPLVARARAARSSSAARPPSALDAALVAAARGALDDAALAARVADFAPAWDVAAPTYAERPDAVRDAVARLRAALAERAATATAPAPTPGGDGDDALAAVAAAIAEEDDALFARAQAVVRAALLDAGRRAGLDDPEDACWLPLDAVRSGEALADPVRARAQAAAARRASARAREWDMPLVVVDGVVRDDAPAAGDRWSGAAGSGGRVRGTIHRIEELAAAAHLPPGAIALCATVTPALALVLAGARGLVTAHGGALDHGAAMARELGVPCVVGCAGAWAALRDGERVELDGDAASVARLVPAADS